MTPPSNNQHLPAIASATEGPATNNSPETAHPKLAIVPRIEQAAITRYRAAYGSNYLRLADFIEDAGTLADAKGMLPYWDFTTGAFRDGVKLSILSGNVHGFVDEDAHLRDIIADYRLALHSFMRRRAALHSFMRRRAALARYAEFEEKDPLFTDEEYAALYLTSRTPVSRAQFELLSAEARSRSFYVSGLTADYIREVVQPAMARALEDGWTAREFAQHVRDHWPDLRNATLRMTPETHMGIVYRVNVMRAYNFATVEAGMNPEFADVLPGAQYLVILDDRTSDICRPLHGTCVSREMLQNAAYTPPFHFSCRTGLMWLNADQWERLTGSHLPADYWDGSDNPPQDGFGDFRSLLWD